MSNNESKRGVVSDFNLELGVFDGCNYCKDIDGHCVYPYYGLAPHNSFTLDGKPLKSEILAKKKWPENFVEDNEQLGCGVYTHCLKCGAGEKHE